MEDEMLRIYDEQGNPLGEATREEVHKLGHWHKTFHCWLISREEGIDYIYFQKRSSSKKDYPNLLDITAAGHILSHETVDDGIREVKEELGIDLSMEELIPLGVIKYSVSQGELIDKELAHNFLLDYKLGMNDFKPQKEEVSGIVKAQFTHFSDLYLNGVSEIKVVGFEINEEGENIQINKYVTKSEFVAHEHSYYEEVIKLIDSYIK
ncbi:NUDIX domain-containing protein [Bacillus sp. CGMCC 1.16607]|uniref:NUDIX hydrolase n=1 Tax=Bacillus sp. CGMCC 1.16607 TaxID=3351842 RepID=UPI00363C5EA5